MQLRSPLRKRVRRVEEKQEFEKCIPDFRGRGPGRPCLIQCKGTNPLELIAAFVGPAGGRHHKQRVAKNTSEVALLPSQSHLARA